LRPDHGGKVHRPLASRSAETDITEYASSCGDPLLSEVRINNAENAPAFVEIVNASEETE
jgi:hypothetical protein